MKKFKIDHEFFVRPALRGTQESLGEVLLAFSRRKGIDAMKVVEEHCFVGL